MSKILEEAMKDAKILKQTALENAKNVLVEAISPKIKEFVETQLGGGGLGEAEMDENVPPMAMVKPEQAMYEKHDDEKADLDLLQKLGLLGMVDDMGAHMPGADTDVPQDHSDLMPSDESEEEEKAKHFKADKNSESDSDEDKEEDKEDSESEEDEKEDMDEANMQDEALELEAKEDMDEAKKELDESVVEITNEDLKAALSEVLGSLKEASVTKGFGDAEDATIKNAGGAGAKGIVGNDEKSGEHQWAEVEPSAQQDFSVKEAKKYIASVQKQNAQLKKEAAEYKQAFEFVKGKLQEVNLFNSKLLYANRLLNKSELNNKQRISVVEAFDRAVNMREVELVYKSLSESFKIAGVLGESKQLRASKAKASRLSTPSSTILKEAIVKEEKGDQESNEPSRWQVLAGITE